MFTHLLCNWLLNHLFFPLRRLRAFCTRVNLVKDKCSKCFSKTPICKLSLFHDISDTYFEKFVLDRSRRTRAAICKVYCALEKKKIIVVKSDSGAEELLWPILLWTERTMYFFAFFFQRTAEVFCFFFPTIFIFFCKEIVLFVIFLCVYLNFMYNIFFSIIVTHLKRSYVHFAKNFQIYWIST